MARSTQERACDQCGKAYQARPYKVRRGDGRYCSNKCAARARADRGILPPRCDNAGEKNGNWKGGRKAVYRRYRERHAEADRVRRRACLSVYRALKRGILVKGPCSACGSSRDVQGHHPDHLKRLEVVWLCARCHRQLHRRER